MEQWAMVRQSDSISVNIDIIQNYKYYFPKDNSNNLVQTGVGGGGAIHLEKVSLQEL